MTKVLISLTLVFVTATFVAAQENKRFEWVTYSQNNLMIHEAAGGDRIPDFSTCGYAANNESVPDVPVKVTVSPVAGDNTDRIQQAVNYISSLPANKNGFKGAVQFEPGVFKINGQIKIESSGVMLRGSGKTQQETTLVAAGQDRRALIQITSKIKSYPAISDAVKITKPVPVGSFEITLENAAAFKAGSRIKILHPGTKEWINSLGMNQFPSDDGKGSWLDWKQGEVDISWNRTVLNVTGNTLKIDAPVTSSIKPEISPAYVTLIDLTGRTSHVVIDNLQLVSEFKNSNPKDEDHAWDGINLEHAENCFISRIVFQHFAGSAVYLGNNTQFITVADCQSAHPVAENGAYRKRAFFTNGEQTLFIRCKSENSRNDFSLGHLSSGPNAFVYCESRNSGAASGSTGRWSTGILFDNVTIDGAPLALTNYETANQGTGWAAANSLLWNCVAPQIICREPPGAHNWAIGVWGEFTGNGYWKEHNSFINPDSFFQTQLSQRIGPDKAAQIMSGLHSPDSVTKVAALESLNLPEIKHNAPVSKTLQNSNGWLTFSDQYCAGKKTGTSWWRGTTLPAKAVEFGPHVTRFVPGKTGQGYTDDLDEVISTMESANIVALEHHWGLWYDRRRDDHEMFRRINGDVWAPFYEFPWARSGQETAWDGLSKYDLQSFNPWYFSRLKEFAELCDKHDKILISQMYFQHNILEAGAHWVDFPWRPDNTIQQTGFPEPPPFENRKRIFMAEDFYNIDHPLRRELHNSYINKVLDTLGDHNVIFVIGDEYTGPLHFTKFWFETVKAWEQKNNKQVLVALSCTKDVQDEILADQNLEAAVDIIELKYWWYTSQDSIYNPTGGNNLAPRQQFREWKGSKQKSPAQIARMINEYRTRYPHKSIVTSLDYDLDPWLTICAGGSLSAFKNNEPASLKGKISSLQIFPSFKNVEKIQYALYEPGQQYLFYSGTDDLLNIDLSQESISTVFQVQWIDSKSGDIHKSATSIQGGSKQQIKKSERINGPAVLWLSKQIAEISHR